MDLAHAALLTIGPLTVAFAELAVAIGSVADLGDILRPEQLQCHALALELGMELGVIGLGIACRCLPRRVKPRLQCGLIHVRRQWP